MKRLLFTAVIFLCLSIIANAQFEKGDKFIVGTASLYFQSLSTSQNQTYNAKGNSFGINLDPGFLHVSNKNTIMGFYTGLAFSSSKIKQNDETNINTQLGAGLGYLIRKYKPIYEKIFWYLEYDGQLSYFYNWQNFVTGTSSNKMNGWEYNANIGVFPALAFKASDRTLVDINFGGVSTGYSYTKYQDGYTGNFIFQIGFSSRVSLGILWKLKR